MQCNINPLTEALLQSMGTCDTALGDTGALPSYDAADVRLALNEAALSLL